MAEKKIAGVTYRCSKLPADLGLRYLLRLTKALGPAAPLLEAILEPQEARRDVKTAAVIRQFIAEMSQGEVYDLIIDLVKECRADGEPCVIGVKPQDVNELLQVFAFAVTTNFADFFGAAGPGGILLKTAKPA